MSISSVCGVLDLGLKLRAHTQATTKDKIRSDIQLIPWCFPLLCLPSGPIATKFQATMGVVLPGVTVSSTHFLPIDGSIYTPTPQWHIIKKASKKAQVPELRTRISQRPATNLYSSLTGQACSRHAFQATPSGATEEQLQTKDHHPSFPLPSPTISSPQRYHSLRRSSPWQRINSNWSVSIPIIRRHCP